MNNKNSEVTNPENRSIKKEILVLILFLCVIMMGISAILIGGASAPGSITAFYRVFIPTILFLPVFLFNRIKSSLRLNKSDSPKTLNLPIKETVFALLGGICFGIDIACWSTGIKLSGAALPTLLANTSVIWTALAGLFIFKERLKALFWIGLGLAGTGVILIFLTALHSGSNNPAGYILGLIAGLFYGIYFIMTQSGRAKLATLDFFWLSCAASSAVLLIFNLALGNKFLGYPLSDLLIFLVVGIVSQSAVWITLNFLQGHLPGSLISPALLGQPVSAAVFGWIILGQELKPIQIIGGAVVLGGIAVIYRSRLGKRK